MKKLLLTLFIGMFLISLTSAELVFERNSEININFPCTFDGANCDATAVCNVSILYANGSYMINNVAATNGNNGMFNISITDSSISGDYLAPLTCCQDSICQEGDADFTITPSGRSVLTEGEGTIYISTLLAMSLFAGFFFILSYQFRPSKDAQKDEDGFLPNDKPGFRFGCLALSFLTVFIILLYAMVSIQTMFPGFERIENSYYIFMWIAGSIFVLIFIFILISLLIQAVDSLRNKRGLSTK